MSAKKWRKETKKADLSALRYVNLAKAKQYFTGANTAVRRHEGRTTAPKRAFKRRVFYHGVFRNCTHGEAEKELRESGK